MDFLPALFLTIGVILTFLHNSQHSHNTVDRCPQIMGHMREEFALCRIGPPDLLQQLHDGLFLLLPGHHNLRDILMVSV